MRSAGSHAAAVQTAGPALEDGFWRRFARDHWELAPLRIEGAPDRLLLGQEELFAALVEAAELYRAAGDDFRAPHERNARLRLLVNRAARLSGVDNLLPAWSDGSVEGWSRRLEALLGGQPFELIANEFQEHSLPLWRQLRQLLGGLYRRVGLPAQRAEAAVFLRNHAVTSFGVHRDDASVFLFVLAGRKRILAWPPGSFDPRQALSTVDYGQLRDRAVVLEGGPGDVLYWPSSHWHVGEADDGLSVSLNLGLHVEHRPASDVAAAAARLVDEQLLGDGRVDTYPFNPDDLQQSVERLPEIFARIDRAVRTSILDGSLEDSLRLSWLNRVTGFGFLRTPPPAPERPLTDDDLAQGERESPVAWIPWSDGRLACSANGRSFAVPSSPGLLRLLQRLGEGTPQRTGTLLDECAGTDEEERDLFRTVLSRLAALRAVASSSTDEP